MSLNSPGLLVCISYLEAAVMAAIKQCAFFSLSGETVNILNMAQLFFFSYLVCITHPDGKGKGKLVCDIYNVSQSPGLFIISKFETIQIPKDYIAMFDRIWIKATMWRNNRGRTWEKKR